MDDAVKKSLQEIGNAPVSGVAERLRKAFDSFDNNATRKALESIAKSPWSPGQLLPELRTPAFDMPKIPTWEEANKYQSAGVLMRRLADSITQWREQLPNDQQPAILAILNGGIQINVERLAEESFHGIRIEGKVEGNPCMVLAHQATVQLLCYIEKVEKEEHRRRIGFIIDGEEKQV